MDKPQPLTIPNAPPIYRMRVFEERDGVFHWRLLGGELDPVITCGSPCISRGAALTAAKRWAKLHRIKVDNFA